MPLLPRSRRGTWLLAGAVWGAACAGLWWALPVVPRDEFQLPANISLEALLPGSGSAVALRRIEPDQKNGEPLFFVETIQIPSARCITTLRGHPNGFGGAQSAAGGKILVFAEAGLSMKPWKADLVTGVVEPLKLDKLATEHAVSSRVSADGNLCALEIVEPANVRVEIWDLRKNRLRRSLPGLSFPASFLNGGRAVALKSTNENGESLRLIDTETLKSIGELAIPSAWRTSSLSVSKDGYRLPLGLTPRNQSDSDSFSLKLLEWNTATGKIEAETRARGSWPHAVGNASFLVHIPDEADEIASALSKLLPRADSYEFGLWSLNQGKGNCYPLNFRVWPGLNTTNYHVSPNGEMLMMAEPLQPQPSFLENLMQRLGFNFPFLSNNRDQCRLYDVVRHQDVGLISAPESTFSRFGPSVRWSPDNKTVAVGGPYDPVTWELWDIPPRKSLTWFAAGAALLALPIALVAWRRTRKLRAA